MSSQDYQDIPEGVQDVSTRQHTSAYVSISQHTLSEEFEEERRERKVVLHTSAHVSIRQHTSAYVSIRPHTSAYEVERCQREVALRILLRYLYFCTSKASKVSTCGFLRASSQMTRFGESSSEQEPIAWSF